MSEGLKCSINKLTVHTTLSKLDIFCRYESACIIRTPSCQGHKKIDLLWLSGRVVYLRGVGGGGGGGGG